MDDRGGSFVAVRRISQGLDGRGNTCHSTSGTRLLVCLFFFSFFSFLFNADYLSFRKTFSLSKPLFRSNTFYRK